MTSASSSQRSIHPSVGLINLGCVRNTVDSQNILGRLKRKGYSVTSSDEADTVIVNTCSFIADAKKESIDVILDLVAMKKQGRIRKIIVTGCLAERYAKELSVEIPGIDALVGTQRIVKDRRQEDVSLTPPHYAYLKICESCFNTCSFCVIPKLKGPFKSRSEAAIIDDVKRLDNEGVKELNIVGQDITAYGMDLYREKRLAKIIRKIAHTAKGIEWVRLLYAYPSHVTDELLEVIASEPKVCRYLDIPLQHVNDRILSAMNRKITKAKTMSLIERIRRRIPGIALRTAFIVGFPGETDKEFKELVSFVKEYPFERVGVFAYSNEEDTLAAQLSGHMPERVKRARRAELMKVQQEISLAFQRERIGSTIRVLIDGRQPDREAVYVGRSAQDAPDVDGAVLVRSAARLSAGDFADVRITTAGAYDLKGEVV